MEKGRNQPEIKKDQYGRRKTRIWCHRNRAKNKFQRQSDKVSIDHTIAIVRDFEGEKSFSGVVKIKPQFK